MRYLLVPPKTICLVTDIWAYSSKPIGDFFLSRLSKHIVTLAFVTPACPLLYIKSCQWSILHLLSVDGDTYLNVLRPHSRHTRYPQDEAYGVQNIGFAAAIEACNRVETLIPATDDSSDSIAFEAINYNLDDLHDARKFTAELNIGQNDAL